MNYKFKLTDVNVKCKEADIKIGGLEIEVNDVNIKDSIDVMKMLPQFIHEYRRATEMPLGAPIINQQEEPNDYTGRESTMAECIARLREDDVVTFTLTADRIVHAVRIEGIEEHHIVTASQHQGINDGRIPKHEIVDIDVTDHEGDGTIEYHIALMLGVPQDKIHRSFGQSWTCSDMDAQDFKSIHLGHGKRHPNSHSVFIGYIPEHDRSVYLEPIKELGIMPRSQAFTQYKNNARKYGYADTE